MSAKFTIEELADFVCEYIRDGKRTSKRDVLDWFRWFERKCGLETSLIQKRRIRIYIKFPASSNQSQ